MNRPDEMRYHAAMRDAERTDAALSLEAPRPSKVRLWIDTNELTDMVDGLTCKLAYGHITEPEEFDRIRATRDRFATILHDIKG